MKFSSASAAVVAAVEKLTACDMSSVAPYDAPQQLRRITRARNQLEAVCAQLTANATRDTHPRQAATWVANTTGVTERDARKLLKFQAKLEKFPDVKTALLNGVISSAKANAIAYGADGDTAIASSLLDGASEKTVEEIEAEARKRARAKAGSEEEHHKRLRQKRSCITWIDRNGLTALLIKDTPEMMAPYLSTIQSHERSLKRDPSVSREAHRCDAFHKAFKGGIGSSRNVVNVHVDYGALRRGAAKDGETCEIAGAGDVPVSVPKSLLGDCILQVILQKDNKLIWFGSRDQQLPERIKAAVRAKFKHRCAICKEYGDQVDHIKARIAGGTNDLDNLQCLCHRCHANKTTHDVPFTSKKYYGRENPRAG